MGNKSRFRAIGIKTVGGPHCVPMSIHWIATKRCFLPLALAVNFLAPASGQLAPPNDAGVTVGQIHLVVRDVEAQKAFWISMIGGKLVENGSLEMIEFPGVYLTISRGDPSGPAAGSVIDHFGFIFKDVPGMIAKWKANHLEVYQLTNPLQGSVHAPEDAVLLEFFQDDRQDVPVRMDHFHMFITDVPAIQEWYAKAFGGVPGRRPRVARAGWVDCDFMPGANLSFVDQKQKLAATKGRAVDHIGFEVGSVDQFVKKLQAQGIPLDTPVRKIPGTKIKSAFLTDPWGTSIELTEGLAPAA
jgi:catechol 2,3-dioxygenase-like lactoylglutathione lyase family enzyme